MLVVTKKAKLSRSRRQAKRRGKLARQERRERHTYQQGVALEPGAQLPELRDGVDEKAVTFNGMPLKSSPNLTGDLDLVYFDLETTGTCLSCMYKLELFKNHYLL
jgi:hypothetical protein